MGTGKVQLVEERLIAEVKKEQHSAREQAFKNVVASRLNTIAVLERQLKDALTALDKLTLENFDNNSPYTAMQFTGGLVDYAAKMANPGNKAGY